MREWFWHILTPLNALPFGFACVFVYIYIFPYFFGPGKACASFFFSVFLSLPLFRYCQGYSNFSLNEKFTSTKTIHPCAPVRWRQTAIKWFPHPPIKRIKHWLFLNKKNQPRLQCVCRRCCHRRCRRFRIRIPQIISYFILAGRGSKRGWGEKATQGRAHCR